jgi:hypothetical protein
LRPRRTELPLWIYHFTIALEFIKTVRIGSRALSTIPCCADHGGVFTGIVVIVIKRRAVRIESFLEACAHTMKVSFSSKRVKVENS